MYMLIMIMIIMNVSADKKNRNSSNWHDNDIEWTLWNAKMHKTDFLDVWIAKYYSDALKCFITACRGLKYSISLRVCVYLL